MKLMKNLFCTFFFALASAFAQDPQTPPSVYLQNRGFTSQFQTNILPSNLILMYRGFVENRYPTNIVFSTEPWRNSIQAAQNSSGYKDKNLLADLKRKIKSRKHSLRVGNESQNIRKLDRVHEYMLCLVSSYVSLFENYDKWFSMADWFPEGEKSTERGGIVFAKRGLEVVLVDTEWQKEYFPGIKSIQSKEVYLDPVILRYIERIGSVHTHPKIGMVRDYAGPSGDLNQGPLCLDGRPVSFNDMTSLTSYLDRNPLQMDAVVSWIGKSTINVDVYFRDIVFTNNVPHNHGDTIVVDIGNFKVSETSR